MIPKDSDSSSDGDPGDPEEPVWSEFDWEKYLRKHDDVVLRYLGFYESLGDNPLRLDEVARLMGWEGSSLLDPMEAEDNDESEDDSEDDSEPYTVHQNPVFVSTCALLLGLQRSWEQLASEPGRIPQTLAVSLLSSLHRCETNSLVAVQSLDFGDYSLAVSQFKRALRDLNSVLSDLHSPLYPQTRDAEDWRNDTLPRVFDLREIWLRVMAQCREEVQRQDRRRHEGGPDA